MAPAERTIGAKEKAILEHSAARDKLKSIRREEERRRGSNYRPTATLNRDLDSIVNGIQSNRQSNRPTATHIPTAVDHIQIDRHSAPHTHGLGSRTANDMQSNGQRGGIDYNRSYDRRDNYHHNRNNNHNDSRRDNYQHSRNNNYNDNRRYNNVNRSYQNQRRY